MKYTSIIDKLSDQYTVYCINGSIELISQLRKIKKDSYNDNERIVVDMPDISKLGDLQNFINLLDISNFFVMVVTEDKNILDEIKCVTKEISHDPIPFTAVIVDGSDYQIVKQEKIEFNHSTIDSRISSLNLPNKNFCVLPWIALETTPGGEYGVCCQANDKIQNDDGKILSVYNSTIEQALDAKSMIKLRQDFLAGRKSKTCDNCWIEEDAGRISKRLNSLDRLKHFGIANQEWTEERKELMMFDLKFGNICNLKCRICGSYSSSQIATEELKILPIEKRESSYSYQTLKLGEWPRKEDHFWKEIDEISDSIRYLEFTGGEPFMIKEHFNFLQTLVDKGLSKNIEIHYNSNGTQYPDSEHIWKHFSLVEIAFSIDDIGPRFEYQRKNADWNEVNENIQKFKELKQKLGNIHLQVCSTINAFNVMYLEDLANWIDSIGFDNVYWNMLHNEKIISIRSLPELAKIRAYAKLSLAKVSAEHHKEFQNAIQYMEQGDSLSGSELCEKIKEKDQIRNESLWNHHPELAEAIGYERT